MKDAAFAKILSIIIYYESIVPLTMLCLGGWAVSSVLCYIVFAVGLLEEAIRKGQSASLITLNSFDLLLGF